MLIFGEDPLNLNDNIKYFSDLEFLLVHDIFLTNTAAIADVILPASSYIEQNGTYTSCDLKVHKVNRINEPENGLANYRIISDLANKFISNFKLQSQEEVFDEIKKVNRFYRDCAIDSSWINDIYNNEYYTDTKKAEFSIYDIDFETLKPEKPSILFSEYYFKTNINKKLMLL